MTMAVFRIEKDKNYTHMSNYHFYDKTLSWKAKGILSNMLSLPDDWDYSLAGLSTLASDGMSATRSAIKELEEHGYLIRRPIRKDGRISDWEYIIYECPEMARLQSTKLTIGEQDVENQQIENQTQLNTNTLNTKELSTKEFKKERKSDSFDKILSAYTTDENTLDLLREWLKVRKAKRAAMTDRAIQMNINKLDALAKQSGMSVDEYLSEVICRGWAAFYQITNYNQPTNARNQHPQSKQESGTDSGESYYMRKLREMGEIN